MAIATHRMAHPRGPSLPVLLAPRDPVVCHAATCSRMPRACSGKHAHHAATTAGDGGGALPGPSVSWARWRSNSTVARSGRLMLTQSRRGGGVGNGIDAGRSISQHPQMAKRRSPRRNCGASAWRARFPDRDSDSGAAHPQKQRPRASRDDGGVVPFLLGAGGAYLCGVPASTAGGAYSHPSRRPSRSQAYRAASLRASARAEAA